MDDGHPLALKSVHRRRTWHEQRRTEALERQRAHRQSLVDHARRMGDLARDATDNLPQVSLLNTLSSTSCPLVSYTSTHWASCLQDEQSEGAHWEERWETTCARPSTEQHQAMEQQSMRENFSRQLMQHEWMTDIPEDLGQDWCICSLS